jgi:hypothetical protein
VLTPTFSYHTRISTATIWIRRGRTVREIATASPTTVLVPGEITAIPLNGNPNSHLFRIKNTTKERHAELMYYDFNARPEARLGIR